MQKSESVIKVENLSKTYRNGVKALSGVSFSVDRGEIFGLLGPNGAGKSSTVRILATLTKITSGKAEVGGYDVFKNSREVRKIIGYVAQSSGVDRWATGRENITLQAQLERVSTKFIRKKVTSLLEWIGLTEAANKLVNTYSGGMKRRLEIAMGLVHEPQVLFLDEPTAGLDPESRRLLWQDLKRLREENNMTVLLTTHYLEEADHLCDRLAIIDNGLVIAQGKPEVLKADVGSDAITIEIDKKIEEANSIINKLDGVIEVSNKNKIISAKVINGKTLIPIIISTLERNSISVQSLSYSTPSLDDVYLNYTGQPFDNENSSLIFHEG